MPVWKAFLIFMIIVALIEGIAVHAVFAVIGRATQKLEAIFLNDDQELMNDLHAEDESTSNGWALLHINQSEPKSHDVKK